MLDVYERDEDGEAVGMPVGLEGTVVSLPELDRGFAIMTPRQSTENVRPLTQREWDRLKPHVRAEQQVADPSWKGCPTALTPELSHFINRRSNPVREHVLRR